MYLSLVALMILTFGLTRLARAFRYRPSDIVFDDDALRVEGGPCGGLALRWTELRLGQCGVQSIVEKSKGKETAPAERWTLRLGNVDVAEADDAVEVASFREVLSAIENRATGSVDDGDARPLPRESSESSASSEARVLACPSCGALVAPSAEPEATCGHCGAAVAIPDDVQGRVRAEALLSSARARVERSVETLLDQPGAASTTALLVVSFLFMAIAWPFTFWGYVHLWRLHRLTPLLGAALAALPFLLIGDGFFLSRLRMVDRRALGSLTTTFGARPPQRSGGPLTCRACNAPLPARETTVVQCVFCGASNVTGVDLRANTRRADSSAQSLDVALAEREVERARWRWRTLGSVPLFIASALLLRALWMP